MVWGSTEAGVVAGMVLLLDSSVEAEGGVAVREWRQCDRGAARAQAIVEMEMDVMKMPLLIKLNQLTRNK